MIDERSWGPKRSCEVGSARTGKPGCSASATIAGARSRSGSRPATISPRSAADTAPASASSMAPPGPRPSRPAVSGRSAARPSIASGSVATTSPGTRLGTERVAPGEVQVHRPAPGLGLGDSPARGRAHVQESRIVGLVGSDLAEPARRVAVQADLVDRLPGADPTQLRRAVGAEDDQRNSGFVGLDDGGMQVGRGRSARAGDHRGRAGAERGAERGEAGAALVEDHDRVDAGLAVEREGDRSRA